MAFTKFEKIRILSILFLTTQRDPRKFPASTAVPVLAFPSSYLKVPIVYASKRFSINIRSHLPSAHSHTNDTQLYLSFRPEESTCEAEALDAMEKCIADIRSWMINDKSMLNDDKNEFVVMCTSKQLSKASVSSIRVDGVDVISVHSAKNLGRNLIRLAHGYGN